MYKISVNDKLQYTVELNRDGKTGLLNGKEIEWDAIKITDGSFNIIKEHTSYNLEVLRADHKEKSFIIRVNGTKYNLTLKDKFDELLKELGMDKAGGNKVNEVKAPMPGLVIGIRVEEGQSVKKGDALIVLEAMKMENILKSPSDGIVKKINVKKGNAVEKNQVLIQFAK